MEMTEENIKELEDIKTKLSKQKNTEKKIGGGSKREPQEPKRQHKKSSICGTVPEERREWMKHKIYEETMAENFPNMVKEINL